MRDFRPENVGTIGAAAPPDGEPAAVEASVEETPEAAAEATPEAAAEETPEVAAEPAAEEPAAEEEPAQREAADEATGDQQDKQPDEGEQQGQSA